MKELLDHLRRSHERWQSASGAWEGYLARSIRRDMGELRRLCQSVRHDQLAGAAR